MIDPVHLLFPSDAPAAPTPAPAPSPAPEHSACAQEAPQLSAGIAEANVATAIFASERADGFDQLLSGELESHRLSAHCDGDVGRARSIHLAQRTLAEDFEQHGTSPDDVKEALHIVRQSARLSEPSPEDRQAEYAKGMAEVTAAGFTDGDLNAARAFIRDLEKVAPGTVASLEAGGAGNNPDLIRKAIREARRRGY